MPGSIQPDYDVRDAELHRRVEHRVLPVNVELPVAPRHGHQGIRVPGAWAEVVQGDLLDPVSVRASLRGITHAYFTYPVADGLLEATTIFSVAARELRPSLW
jgi:uncharacterized protein YbjT (DUF2867 family)